MLLWFVFGRVAKEGISKKLFSGPLVFQFSILVMCQFFIVNFVKVSR